MPACDRGNLGGGTARVRPQPSSNVHEGLHQCLNHRILDPKGSGLVHPSHTKNMGLSKFRWLAQAQINYIEMILESKHSDKKHYY